MAQLKISPSIGIARLGNSRDTNIGQGQYYLAPDSIGGLPYQCDQNGNNLGTPVSQFKDQYSRILRQGQAFKIYDDNGNGSEITVGSVVTGLGTVSEMSWTVHVANKKAAWYQYSELQGNLLYPNNSYTDNGVAFRNATVTGADRQSLIIDPGPRTISGNNQRIELDDNGVGAPAGYPISFPPLISGPDAQGENVTSLGTLLTDSQGRLVVIGGYGASGGSEKLVNYGGQDTWHDDIADGAVYCEISFAEAGVDPVSLQAWVIIGSPDFAPEIVNISTLSDTIFDVEVRQGNVDTALNDGTGFNTSFQPIYERDILPIINRLSAYQWVANVQSMSAFFEHKFDYSDNNSDPSSDAYINRQTYFAYFRALNDKSSTDQSGEPQQVLFSAAPGQSLPMMPLNSGSNSVSNDIIVKFLSLNATQYFFMEQWAAGNFISNPGYQPFLGIDPKDQASVGNCVGLPMCPGIEVTWSTQNPNLYDGPYQIAHHMGKDGYNTTGLTPSRDECAGGGCEPGDLTKRMACPWQADFFQCTIQYVNFTDDSVNKVADPTPEDPDNMKPKPPTYYAYWWPPQSPWDVLTGDVTEATQAESHLPAGQQVNYARGINSFGQMVEHWPALAFIRNTNMGHDGADANYPYFTETERNHELFSYQEVGIGTITGNDADNETTIPVFYIESDNDVIYSRGEKAHLLMSSLEERAFKPIKTSPISLTTPRSGTRSRR